MGKWLVRGVVVLLAGLFLATVAWPVLYGGYMDWHYKRVIDTPVIRKEKSKLEVTDGGLFSYQIDTPDAFYIQIAGGRWLRCQSVDVFNRIDRGRNRLTITRRYGEDIIISVEID